MNGVSTNGGSWLEPILSRFTEVMESHHDLQWEAGHVVCEALAEHAKHRPAGATGEQVDAARAELFKAFAAAAHCTAARVRQLAVVYATFCSDGDQRAREKPWGWHRSLRNAAERTETPVVEMVQRALANGWGAEDLDAYQAGSVERVSFKGTCGECGYKMRLTCSKPGIRQHVGHKVLCGFCAEPVGCLS